LSDFLILNLTYSLILCTNFQAGLRSIQHPRPRVSWPHV